MKDSKTYKDYADEGYMMFLDLWNSGKRYNMMAAMANEACEKYLKHIVEEISDKVSEEQYAVLHTHNLNKILKYMESNLSFPISEKESDALRKVNGYYFTARYPSVDSDDVTEKELEDCLKAMEICRSLVDKMPMEEQ